MKIGIIWNQKQRESVELYSNWTFINLKRFLSVFELTNLQSSWTAFSFNRLPGVS